MVKESEGTNQVVENALNRLGEIHTKNGFLIMATKNGEAKTGETVADILKGLPDPVAEEVWSGINKAGLRVAGIDERPKEDLLTHREEIEHFIKIRKGDLNSRDELIEKNKRLVRKIAFKYVGRGLDLDDLEQEGQIGLFKAVGKFDWKMGYKFSTYAVRWVEIVVSTAIKNTGSAIRHPLNFIDGAIKLDKVERALTQSRYGVRPTEEELAEILEISPDKVRDLKENLREVDSLDETLDEYERTRLKRVVDKTSGPEEIVQRKEEQEYLSKLVNRLPTEERVVWLLKHDSGYPEPTFQDIGDLFGFSRQNAQLIEKSANAKLKRYYLLDRAKEAGKHKKLTTGV